MRSWLDVTGINWNYLNVEQDAAAEARARLEQRPQVSSDVC
ncbi:MAG: hypothetical protein AAF267_05685 [Deinococcota bacterium]